MAAAGSADVTLYTVNGKSFSIGIPVTGFDMVLAAFPNECTCRLG